MKVLQTLFLITYLLLTVPVQAGLEAFDFTAGVDEARYKSLISELRCLVCQNQSLADSDAGLAHDLRKEVYELMDQGQSDEQIVDFLVQRYGDFVLYNPPVKPATYLIWFGPFALLLIGLFVLIRTLRQHRQDKPAEFSVQEKARLAQLLKETDSSGERQA